jgi:nitronate monooxygenase
MNRSTQHPSLFTRLGLSMPVIQAPMAGIDTPALAAAVSNAGGMGSLGVGAMGPETARAAIRKTRSLTDKPFNVNLFCHAPAQADPTREAAWLAYLAPRFAEFGATPPVSLRNIYLSFLEDPAMYAMLLEERPPVVSFHFGLPPAAQLAALRAAGIVLLASATNLDDAAQVAAAGVDAIVAQGVEAGGHRGLFDMARADEALGTLALVRLLVRELKLPVIASGGIMDGAGIAAVLALGAQAAQMGTAFIGCPESAADPAFRANLLGARARRTVFTRVISGRPARAIANRFTQLGEDPAHPSLPDYPIVYDAGKALHAAAKAQGNAEFAAHWAGQAAPLSRVLSAADLMTELKRETATAIASLRENLAFIA